MSVPTSKRHNALRRAGFSAATILPGESAAEFEKLHQALICRVQAEWCSRRRDRRFVGAPALAQEESRHLSHCRAGPSARDRNPRGGHFGTDPEFAGIRGSLGFLTRLSRKRNALQKLKRAKTQRSVPSR